MKSETIFFKLLVVTSIFFLFSDCNIGNVSEQGGTEVGDAVLSGQIVYENGEPAANALAKIVPARHNPYLEKTQYQLAIADDNGIFKFDSLETGFYNLYGEGNKKMVFDDSIYIDGSGSVTIQKNILKDPGGISGVVRLEGKDDHRGVIIIIMGSNKLSVPLDSAGNFRIDNLAEGEYIVRFIPTGGDFDVLELTIPVKSGESNVLPDTIDLPYNGLPTPRGLSVAYDTVTQTARLSWLSVDTAKIAGYNIYRSKNGSNFELITERRVNKSDTVYHDKVPIPGIKYEYRVVSINSNGQESEMRDEANDIIHATSFTAVQTKIIFSLSGDAEDSTTGIGDSVLITVRYDNPIRKNTTITWFIDTLNSLSLMDSLTTSVKTSTIAGKSGTDSLMWSWDTPGKKRLGVLVTDSKGHQWEAIAGIEVIVDSLHTFAGHDTSVHMGTILKLSGSASQKWGSISKWEWNINGSGFVQTSTSDTIISIPEKRASTYPCILRVTDNNGYTGLDTINITIGFWRQINLENMALMSLSDILAFDGKLYIAGDKAETESYQSVYVYDFNKTWTIVGGGPLEESKGHKVKLTSFNNTLYAAYYKDSGPVIVKKLEAGLWKESFRGEVNPSRVQITGNDSNLFIVTTRTRSEKMSVTQYVNNEWTPVDSGYYDLISEFENFNGMTICSSNDNLIIAFIDKFPKVEVIRYHIPTRSWHKLPSIESGLGKITNVPIAIMDEKPVIITSEMPKSSKFSLKSFNGSLWENIGQSSGNDEFTLFTDYMSFNTVNNRPQLSFLEEQANQIITMALINGVWEYVAAPIELKFHPGKIFMATQDERIFSVLTDGGTGKIHIIALE